MNFGNYIKEQTIKYGIKFCFNEDVFQGCQNDEDVKDLIDDFICQSRQHREIVSVVKKFSVITGLDTIEWVCELSTHKLVGVLDNTEKSFSVEDIRQLAEFIDALCTMEYEINADVINKLMKEMYCGLEFDKSSKYYKLHIEDTALEYLGVA